jgi:hypothetical protein
MLSKISGMGYVGYLFLGAWILGLCALTELLIWIFFGSLQQMNAANQPHQVAQQILCGQFGVMLR